MHYEGRPIKQVVISNAEWFYFNRKKRWVLFYKIFGVKIKTKSIIIHSTPEKVFAYMDSISNTGMHMTKNSMQMMGSKLALKQISENTTGPDSKFLWYGKVMGFTMGFTVVVTKWIKDKEKVWETVGETKMNILKWYQMRLIISSEGQITKATLSIAYTKPENYFFKFVAFFLAPLYANWCLNNMLNDSKLNLEKKAPVKGKGGIQV